MNIAMDHAEVIKNSKMVLLLKFYLITGNPVKFQQV